MKVNKETQVGTDDLADLWAINPGARQQLEWIIAKRELREKDEKIEELESRLAKLGQPEPQDDVPIQANGY